MWRCKGHESFCLQFPWDCCRNKMLVTIVHSLHVVNFILTFCQCEQSQPCDQVLTLVSNERIPFTPTMRMLLEVQDTTPRNIFQTQSHKTTPPTNLLEHWKMKFMKIASPKKTTSFLGAELLESSFEFEFPGHETCKSRHRLPWRSPLHQRATQMAAACAECNCRIYILQPFECWDACCMLISKHFLQVY